MQAFRQISKQDETILDITKLGSDSEKAPPFYSPDPPKAEQHFAEYKKIYLTSYILSMEKSRLKLSIDKLLEQIHHIEATQLEIAHKAEEKSSEQKNKQQYLKRSRRKADDIVRKWECREEYCGRSYGAYASLLQHVKLKHPSVYEQYC